MPVFQVIFPCNQGLATSNFSRQILAQITDPYTTLKAILELKTTRKLRKIGERTNVVPSQPQLIT